MASSGPQKVKNFEYFFRWSDDIIQNCRLCVKGVSTQEGLYKQDVEYSESWPMMTSSNGNIFRVTGQYVRGIHRSPLNSPHKGQWRGFFMFSLICVWINDWVNNREAGDLRRYRAHYDVIVMFVGLTSLHCFSSEQGVVVSNCVSATDLKYGTYEYPFWSRVFGWILAALPLLPLPVCACAEMMSQKGTFCEVRSCCCCAFAYWAHELGYSHNDI